MNLTGSFQQFYVELSYTTVLAGIVQRFLQNSKLGTPNIDRRRTLLTTPEINLHFLPLRKFLAPAFNACNNAHIFQL